jgi:hypothetical protein
VVLSVRLIMNYNCGAGNGWTSVHLPRYSVSGVPPVPFVKKTGGKVPGEPALHAPEKTLAPGVFPGRHGVILPTPAGEPVDVAAPVDAPAPADWAATGAEAAGGV